MPLSEARRLKRRPLASRPIPRLNTNTDTNTNTNTNINININTHSPPARLHKSTQKGAPILGLPFLFLQAHPWIGKH